MTKDERLKRVKAASKAANEVEQALQDLVGEFMGRSDSLSQDLYLRWGHLWNEARTMATVLAERARVGEGVV